MPAPASQEAENLSRFIEAVEVFNHTQERDMEAKHTPGPWYVDEGGAIWRRPPAELYQNGGGVAGDKPLATAHAGWHGEGVTGYPAQANARLIAAAPELLEALKLAAHCLKWHAAQHPAGMDCKAIEDARAAIANATQ